jgi:hypothetical protein
MIGGTITGGHVGINVGERVAVTTQGVVCDSSDHRTGLSSSMHRGR